MTYSFKQTSLLNDFYRCSFGMVFPSHRLFMVMPRYLKVLVHSSVRLSVTILTSLQVLSYQLK